MRTFAQATRCPDCDAARAPGPRCTECGLLLQGPLADELWGHLLGTDSTLAQMRAERDAATQPASTQPVPPGPAPVQQPVLHGEPLTAPSLADEPGRAPVRRRVSVAAVLLALGALLVVVAAFVFVAVTWGQLSLGTRVLVLGASTAVAAIAATLISRRALRASAEAAWAVTLAMLALDLAAARGAGLLGLDLVSFTSYLVAAGMLMALVGTGVAAALRGAVRRALVVPQLVSLASLAVAGFAAMEAWDTRVAWRLLVAAGIAALVAAAHLALKLHVVAVPAAGATMVFGGAHVLLAWVAVTQAETWRAAWVNGRAWPSVASVLLLLGAGWVGSRLSHEADPDAGSSGQSQARRVLVSSASFAAAGTALTWVLVPLLADAEAQGTAVVVMVAAAVLALACTPLSGDWGLGLRALAALLGLWSFVGCLDDVAFAGRALAATPLPAWQQPFGVRLDALGGEGPTWWIAVLQLLVAAGSLLVAALMWQMKPGRAATWVRQVGPPVAFVLVAVACLLTAAALRTPVALLSVVALVLGAAVVASILVEQLRPGQAPIAGVLLASSSYEALAAPELSAIVWFLGGLVLAAGGAGLSRADTPQLAPLSAMTTALAGGFGVASLLATAETFDLSLTTTVLLVVSAALALLAAATLLRRRPGLRTGLETAAVATAVLAVAGGVAVAAEDRLGFLAVVLTLLGAGTALLAVLVADRRRLAPVAGALLALAWWLRLVASDVETVEAYTLPVAAPLLLAGLWVMLRRPGTPSLVALLPGLLLATAPSLPLALAEPASGRGLLLGLAALALVGAGARLSWVAPFAVGVAVTVLLSLRHLTPVADALPRWVLLATAGLLLLTAGTTWERRARDARRGLAAVRAMR